MSERTLRLRIGLFVLVALLLLAALVVMFGSAPTLFRRTTTYTVRFTDAPGIGPGTPVRRSGVRIGEVRQVILDDERGIVRVEIAVNTPFTLRRNEQPMLVVGLLGSDAAIDFVQRRPEAGEPDRGPVEPGAELVGTRAANVNTLLAGASEVVPTTQETLNDIRKSMQRLERLAGRVEKMTPLAEETLREYRDLARASRQTIPDLQRTNEEVRALARSLRETVPEVRQTNREVGELARSARQAIPDLQRTNDEVRELARSVREVVPEVRQTNREVGELARSLRQALPDLERTNDEVRQLARTAREAIPVLRANAEDVGAAARNWGRLGERLDVLVQSNQDKVVKALDQLNENLGRINRLLSDENLRSAQNTLNNVATASQQFPSMSRSAEDILTQGRTSVRQLNTTLVRLDAVLADLQRVLRPIGEGGPRMLRNLDESLAKLNLTMDDVRALMRAVDRSDGTLRRFLTDPSLYNNLNCAVVSVARLMPRLDRILKDFETFADKLARHPEAIGLGGVVRPGSGLKNPPTPAPSAMPVIIPPPPH
jgi:phospholipid/cholesterol/gamma-HCH transport system substrate-binding protein